MPLNSNLLSWWKANELEYPILSKLAKRYLCVPATSLASERVFSSARDLVSAQRSCLCTEHVDKLLFLKKNLGRTRSRKNSKKNIDKLHVFLLHPCNRLMIFLLVLYPQIESLGLCVVYIVYHVARIKKY